MSSSELFCLSSQMMGKFGDTMLTSNISPESLPVELNEFFVYKIEEIKSSFDLDRPIHINPVEFSSLLQPSSLPTESVTALKMLCCV